MTTTVRDAFFPLVSNVKGVISTDHQLVGVSRDSLRPKIISKVKWLKKATLGSAVRIT